MVKVGDKVKVTFNQPVMLGATAFPPMTIEGKIAEEMAEHWVVELALSINGKNRIVLPKSAALAAA